MLNIGINQRSTYALLILGLMLILLYVLLVIPYIALLDESEKYLDSTRYHLDRNTSLLNKKSYYVDEIERIKKSSDVSQVYLKSNKKSLASAELQQRFKHLAKISGTELISSQSAGENNNQDIQLRTRLKTDTHGLQRLLYQIESGSPRLVIKEIQISKDNPMHFNFKQANPENQSLDIRMLVTGYMRPEIHND